MALYPQCPVRVGTRKTRQSITEGRLALSVAIWGVTIKHTPFYCRYVYTSAACNGYSCTPSPRVSMTLTASAWQRRRATSACVQIWRHPQTATTKQITRPPEEDRATTIGNMHKKLVKIGRVVPKIWFLTTDRHTHHNTLFPLSGME